MTEFDGEATKIVAAIVFVAIPVASMVCHYAETLRSAIHRRLSGAGPARTSWEEEKSDDGSDLNCVICLGKVAAGERLRALPCDHRFHGDCVDEWLRARSTCPLCRCLVVPLDSGHLQQHRRLAGGGFALIGRIWNWMDPLGLSPELARDLFENSYYLSRR
ncbi:hypothetical protein NMG60_11005904 [Bertholletia excelsa]